MDLSLNKHGLVSSDISFLALIHFASSIAATSVIP
jgi:hypothetical protein